jgi:prepilin-type processing-associated H-X9-DG protein
MSAGIDNHPEFNDTLPKPRSRRGIRIIEVMVVIGIIGVLIGLLLPATRCDWPAARRAQCQSNMKNIVLALHAYEQQHHAIPPAYTVDANGKPLHSWRTLILPYLENEELYQTIDLSKPWNDPANAKARETPVSIYRCPESARPRNMTTFLAIAGPNSCLVPGKGRRLTEITDSHASTLVVIEAGEENAVPWMAPVDADESLVLSIGPNTEHHHAGGMNACFVDGGVRFFSANVPANVRRAIMSISGNDKVADDGW